MISKAFPALTAEGWEETFGFVRLYDLATSSQTKITGEQFIFFLEQNAWGGD